MASLIACPFPHCMLSDGFPHCMLHCMQVLFAANTFVGCVGAAALGWTGAMLSWEAANNYYYTAAALMVALAVLSPAVSLLAGARSSGEESRLLIVAPTMGLPTMLDPTPVSCSDACPAESSINTSTSTHPVESCTHACTSTKACAVPVV